MEASDWLMWTLTGYCYVLETRVSLIIRVYGHIIIIIIITRIRGHITPPPFYIVSQYYQCLYKLSIYV